MTNVFEPHMLTQAGLVLHRLGGVLNRFHLQFQGRSVSRTFVEGAEIFDCHLSAIGNLLNQSKAMVRNCLPCACTILGYVEERQ